eukprot:2888730-Prymnesium_polylepis.1
MKLSKVCPWGVCKNDDGKLEASGLKAHFAKQLKPGMTLENYGKVWSIGHQIPAVYFDFADPEDNRRCNSQENLVCDYVVKLKDGELTNSEKGSKLPTDEVMILQGKSSWPKSWKGILPTASVRSKLEHDAWSGVLSILKESGKMGV